MKTFRRSQRQRISPELQSVPPINPITNIDRSNSAQSFRMTDNKNNHQTLTVPSSIVDTNTLHDRIKATNNYFQRHHSVDPHNMNSSDSVNIKLLVKTKNLLFTFS